VKWSAKVAAATRTGQDRADVVAVSGGYLLVLADGAGGTSGGAAAAEAVVAAGRAAHPSSREDCVRFLTDLDQRLRTIGETTAVVVLLARSQVVGASVGDSEAWLVTPSDWTELTRDQKRKPLLGSGAASPVGFGPLPLSGRVLVGSDGLFKYVPHDAIRKPTMSPLADAAEALIHSARLPSGSLHDDVSVILATT